MSDAWTRAEEVAGLTARGETFKDLAADRMDADRMDAAGGPAGDGYGYDGKIRQRTEPSPVGDTPWPGGGEGIKSEADLAPADELPERVELTETRYYIGMWGEWGRMLVTYHPGGYVTGAARDPRAVLSGGPTDLYPVSREIALAFQDDGAADEDDD